MRFTNLVKEHLNIIGCNNVILSLTFPDDMALVEYSIHVMSLRGERALDRHILRSPFDSALNREFIDVFCML